jgi:hypothetical protein
VPTYCYRCQLCGEVSEHYVPMQDRHEPQECLQPYCEGRADFEFCPPHDTSPMELREHGPIFTEKQLERGWRDKGTTGREGGAGKFMTFDQKPAR